MDTTEILARKLFKNMYDTTMMIIATADMLHTPRWKTALSIMWIHIKMVVHAIRHQLPTEVAVIDVNELEKQAEEMKK